MAAGSRGEPQRQCLGDPMISLDMRIIAGKAVCAVHSQIIAEGCRVQGLEEGKRPFAETDGAPLPPAAHSEQLICAKNSAGRRPNLLGQLQPMHQLFKSPPAPQQVQGLGGKLSGCGQHREEPPDFRQRWNSLCRKPAAPAGVSALVLQGFSGGWNVCM